MSHNAGDRQRRFNATWSMALGWLIVILAVLFPFPWWW
jgi:hypothetical protein